MAYLKQHYTKLVIEVCTRKGIKWYDGVLGLTFLKIAMCSQSKFYLIECERFSREKKTFCDLVLFVLNEFFSLGFYVKLLINFGKSYRIYSCISREILDII